MWYLTSAINDLVIQKCLCQDRLFWSNKMNQAHELCLSWHYGAIEQINVRAWILVLTSNCIRLVYVAFTILDPLTEIRPP
jgi:hypothetical protein